MPIDNRNIVWYDGDMTMYRIKLTKRYESCYVRSIYISPHFRTRREACKDLVSILGDYKRLFLKARQRGNVHRDGTATLTGVGNPVGGGTTTHGPVVCRIYTVERI